MSNDTFQWVAAFMMIAFLSYLVYRLATDDKGNEFPKDFIK